MNLDLTESFKEDLRELPQWLQRLALDKLDKLAEDLKYPSLRVRKVQGFRGRWEASINMAYRVTFVIEGNNLRILRIGSHKILTAP